MKEYIVFVSKDHYNPVGIIRTLGESGIRPIVVVVKSEPQMVTKSKYIKRAHVVNSSAEGLELILSTYATSKTEKSFILTGDDVTVELLDSNYDRLKDYFYFYNAGKAGRIHEVMNKDYMCALAEKHGFKVAKTWRCAVGEIPEDIVYPVITKAINSFGAEWKSIVRICRNERDLLDAYAAVKQSDHILLQQYMEKVDEQSYDGFAVNRGSDVFFTVQNNEVYHLDGQYAPFWKNRNVDDEEFMKSATAMLTEIGFEGIFEFEFLVGVDGNLYFLEVNLRNTVNGWTSTVAGMPLATLWCRAMEAQKTDPSWRREIPEGFTTMAECFDYDKRVKTGMLTHRQWMKEYKAVNAKLYKGRNDFAPFFSFMWYKFKNRKKK